MGFLKWLRSNKGKHLPSNSSKLRLKSKMPQNIKTEDLFTSLRKEEKELFRSEEINGYLLTLEEGHPKNKIFVLIGAEINVGRSPINEVTIDDGLVSEKHFKISILRGQTPILADLGSTNGTYVNQKKVQKIQTVPLKDGDEIHIGLTKLRFHIDPERNLKEL